ncbi:polysaccharide biosynthesis/export family protein [Pseudoflavitalea rhizosphaerae]|uniref:polysaccharide biosynthesis/export family protein n=1 Tax=Pseudoflavitalea rhizosphaerae TaxID=1884793 RepID=UPI0013E08D52|nr:polysaccharide biosynthesis/export family protein [Pseudoflavitalea rhizosphaerae]
MLTICSLISCVSNKELTAKAVYFKNANDSSLRKTVIEFEPKLQKGDILYIGVSTANDASAKLFNLPNFYASSVTAGAGGTTSGYLIDESGDIVFPMIGKLHVDGTTKAALTDTLTRKIREYANDAIVSIRLINYKITVLGEVAKPGSFTIPSERVTVLEAIGLAGDLTTFGKRDNIRVIRETNQGREMGQLNLNDGNIFSSPYYYLRQNDVVYIEMNSRKMANADQTNARTLSIGLGIVSAVSLIVATITRF